MTPGLRKFALTAHVTVSVGWLGAVLAYLAVAIACLVGQDADHVVGSGYFAMELTGWYVIVPLSVAALLTGLIQSLGTDWGLFRHYWIAVKFALTVGAVTILLLHMPVVSRRNGVQAEVVHAGGGLLVLLATTALSVYKPWGRTRYGRRKHQECGAIIGGTAVSVAPILAEPETVPTGRGLSTGLTIFIAVLGMLLAAFVLMHLSSSLGSHSH
jgi:hypothetical protein